MCYLSHAWIQVLSDRWYSASKRQWSVVGWEVWIKCCGVEGVSWMKLDFQPKLQKRTRKIFEEKQKQVNTRNSENVTLLNLKKNFFF